MLWGWPAAIIKKIKKDLTTSFFFIIIINRQTQTLNAREGTEDRMEDVTLWTRNRPDGSYDVVQATDGDDEVVANFDTLEQAHQYMIQRNPKYRRAF